MAVKGISISLLFALILVGCGGSGNEGNNPAQSTASDTKTVDNETVQSSTGYFVDAPVKGLRYRTDTLEGMTDALGRFNYQPGESISFHIGGTELGVSDAVGFMTPGSLDETGQWDGTRAINIARLLITLDSDQNPLNGIVIDEQAHLAFADLGFDLSASPEQLTESSVLREALANADRIGLVTVDDARDHLGSVAEQLPDSPSEADIIALLDTGPNYSGRQTPMTATPDNLRRAAQVFWADPAKPAPDMHWLFRLFNPQIFLDVLERHVLGLAQPPGIRVVGDVQRDQDKIFESASLVISFDDHSRDGRVYNGSVLAEISPDFGYSLEFQVGDAEPELVDMDAFGYGLFFYDFRASGADGSIGIHGWQSVKQAVENPYAMIRDWTMDATIRDLHSEKSVRLVAETPIHYSENREGMGEPFGLTTIIRGRVEVTHWALGNYLMDTYINWDAPTGEVDGAAMEFFNDSEQSLGTLDSTWIPDSIDLQERVRVEMAPGESDTSGEFELIKLETPLTGEEVQEADPVWIYDYLEYEIVVDDLDESKPVEVILTAPPYSIDPDGAPLVEQGLTWLVNGEEVLPVRVGGSMFELSLVLEPELQTADTVVCIRNRSVYADGTVEKKLSIDLAKQAGILHRVPYEDATCGTL